ncbi:MAG: amidohydrolase family protein, partial [Deinococcales bacterium]
ALRLAGIHQGTINPENGVIVRDDRGEASGLLLEHAQRLVAQHIPKPSDQETITALDAAAKDFARLGVTSVHHMAAEPASYFRNQALRASQADYGLRVWSCFPQEDADHAIALGIATGQGGSRFSVGGAKFFADGALGSLTAWMLEPFDGTQEYGMAVHGYEVMRERFPKVIAAGLTPVIHAIGDAANRAVIDVLEETRELWQLRGLRPRLEHVQHLNTADVPRLANLGIVASMQPIHLVFDSLRIRALLNSRIQDAYRFSGLLKAGVPLAFGSDTPVANPDVIKGLQAAISQKSQEGSILNAHECLSCYQALQAYTTGAAYAISRENNLGKLAEGYEADLVILSHDPLASLDNLKIKGTMLAGHWTYQA